jgi:hypothetical protein
MIIFHHNDLDGKCAAAICHCWAGIPDDRCEFVEMDYAKKVPLEMVKPGERVWIVDFSFSVADMTQLLEITQDVIWIDHHKTAIEKFKDFPHKIRGIRKDGEAGCVLTWKYMHWWSARGDEPEELPHDGRVCYLDRSPAYPVPRAVTLLGDYDTWTMAYKDTVQFYEGMKVMDWAIGDPKWMELFICEADGVYGDGRPIEKVDKTRPIIEAGYIATRYRDAYCSGIVKTFGFESVIDGIKCWVTNLYGFGSLGFGAKMKDYPICAACISDGLQWTVSLYSTQVDVSVICKNHGGGGHKGAAGFVSKTFPFERTGGTK